MGLLDDAIREHLELKRRHGADPDEVARQENEALGAPVAAGVRASPAGRRERAADRVGARPEPRGRPATRAGPVAELGAPRRRRPRRRRRREPRRPRRRADPGSTRTATRSPPTRRSTIHLRGRRRAGAEDLLEETPDFLQETPEHDRLWFEQQPPRDFDWFKKLLYTRPVGPPRALNGRPPEPPKQPSEAAVFTRKGGTERSASSLPTEAAGSTGRVVLSARKRPPPSGRLTRHGPRGPHRAARSRIAGSGAGSRPPRTRDVHERDPRASARSRRSGGCRPAVRRRRRRGPPPVPAAVQRSARGSRATWACRAEARPWEPEWACPGRRSAWRSPRGRRAAGRPRPRRSPCG